MPDGCKVRPCPDEQSDLQWECFPIPSAFDVIVSEPSLTSSRAEEASTSNTDKKSENWEDREPREENKSNCCLLEGGYIVRLTFREFVHARQIGINSRSRSDVESRVHTNTSEDEHCHPFVAFSSIEEVPSKQNDKERESNETILRLCLCEA